MAKLVALVLLAAGLMIHTEATLYSECSPGGSTSTSTSTPRRLLAPQIPRMPPPTQTPTPPNPYPVPTAIATHSHPAAPTTCAELQAAMSSISDDSSKCVKVSHTIQLNDCTQVMECADETLYLNPVDTCTDPAKATVTVTVNSAPSCGAARPTVRATKQHFAMFQIGAPPGGARAVLVLQSVIVDCGGVRPALYALGGKSVSLVNTDFIDCAFGYGSDGAVYVSGGATLSVKGGTFRNDKPSANAASISIQDASTSTGTLLAVSKTSFLGTTPPFSTIIQVKKSTPKKLKASIKGCLFASAAATGNELQCAVASYRNEGPGEPLTVDMSRTVFSGRCVL
jgi:hypothetical protein